MAFTCKTFKNPSKSSSLSRFNPPYYPYKILKYKEEIQKNKELRKRVSQSLNEFLGLVDGGTVFRGHFEPQKDYSNRLIFRKEGLHIPNVVKDFLASRDDINHLMLKSHLTYYPWRGLALMKKVDVSRFMEMENFSECSTLEAYSHSDICEFFLASDVKVTSMKKIIEDGLVGTVEAVFNVSKRDYNRVHVNKYSRIRAFEESYDESVDFSKQYFLAETLQNGMHGRRVFIPQYHGANPGLVTIKGGGQSMVDREGRWFATGGEETKIYGLVVGYEVLNLFTELPSSQMSIVDTTNQFNALKTIGIVNASEYFSYKNEPVSFIYQSTRLLEQLHFFERLSNQSSSEIIALLLPLFKEISLEESMYSKEYWLSKVFLKFTRSLYCELFTEISHQIYRATFHELDILIDGSITDIIELRKLSSYKNFSEKYKKVSNGIELVVSFRDTVRALLKNILDYELREVEKELAWFDKESFQLDQSLIHLINEEFDKVGEASLKNLREELYVYSHLLNTTDQMSFDSNNFLPEIEEGKAQEYKKNLCFP